MTEPTDKSLLDQPSAEELDEYLKGDSSVSRQYRQLPGAEVPASLDRLVLRQAEDAVKRPSRPAWMRWTAPLAVAASAVLVVSIVMETGLRDETMVASPSMQTEQVADAEAEAPIETKMIEEPASAVPLTDTTDPDASTEERAVVQLEMPVPPPPKLETPTPPAFASAETNAPPPVAAPAPQTKALAKQLDENETSDAAPQEQRAPEPDAVLSYSRPISTTGSMATLQRTYTDPEAWLKDIRQLRKDNKQEEADREWQRFRAAFPDYDVAETDIAREAKK